MKNHSMRETIFVFLGLCWIASVHAWSVTSPSNNNNNNNKNDWIDVKNGMKHSFHKSVAAGVAATIVASNLMINPPAFAVDFTGSYSDPNHPNCARLVAVEGNTAILTGADGNPGCPTGEGRPWRLLGTVEGDTILVDFTPKGGPKDLKGQWEMTKSKAPGIRWPDGNKWTLQGKPN